MKTHSLLVLSLVMHALCGCSTTKSITQAFPADGITKVILRASAADSATISSGASKTKIVVVGTPTGGAKGYHSPDPDWRETPPEKWGFAFVAQRFGSVLVISTQKEMSYIHHHYVLTDLSVRVPSGVEVIREQRKLSNDLEPDLRAP